MPWIASSVLQDVYSSLQVGSPDFRAFTMTMPSSMCWKVA